MVGKSRMDGPYYTGEERRANLNLSRNENWAVARDSQFLMEEQFCTYGMHLCHGTAFQNEEMGGSVE